MPKSDWMWRSEIMNAAGSLGFDPGGDTQNLVEQLGAFVTNPISWRKRTPAESERVARTPGGLLLHSGHPNPGFKLALRRYAARWKRSPAPVIVHLLVEEPWATAQMARALEEVEGVAGIELGLPTGATVADALAHLAAAEGELPVLLRLPFESRIELAGGIQTAGAANQVVGFSLAPPRGAWRRGDGELAHGRLYGPAVFPMALEAVWTLAKLGVQVVGAGGVMTLAQAKGMLAAGASAVQVDLALWGVKPFFSVET